MNEIEGQGIVQPSTEAVVPPPKKVAICGFSKHKDEAPFKDETWEIWGLNDLYEAIPRWNRWFEMHSNAQIADYATRKQGKPYLEGLAGLNVPVYMQNPRPEVPTSVMYPIEEVKAEFGNYFTNSISYMIAMAIREKYEEIAVYGVDMAQDCLCPDMRVLCTNHLWMPVANLTTGQTLLAFDESLQYGEYKIAVVQSLSRIKRPCHKITMADGAVLIASVGHKWVSRDRWLRTDEVEVLSNLTKMTNIDEAAAEVTATCHGVDVVSSEYIGEQEVIGITTDTGTLIVEGFASHNSEYDHQRPSCEYMLGYARGRGIKVTLPKTSDLLKVRWMYGYEDEQRSAYDARVKEIYDGVVARQQQAIQQKNAAASAELQYLGAIDAIKTLQRVHV